MELINSEQWKILSIYCSPDKSACRYLIMLKDNNIIECARFLHNNHNHLCISTQVGCKVGCSHCATTYSLPRYVRNITYNELYSICNYYLSQSVGNGLPTIISFSGHGEPLMNWNAVKMVMDRLDKNSYSNWHITTIGIKHILPKLLKINNNRPSIYLSLHGATDDLRYSVIPKHDFISSCDELKEFAIQYLKISGRAAFNYLLTTNNMSDVACEYLKVFFSSELSGVELRLLPINPVNGNKVIEPPSGKEIKLFAINLSNTLRHIKIRIPLNIGIKQGIACGQLRHTQLKENK